jgi:hypothetical protein
MDGLSIEPGRPQRTGRSAAGAVTEGVFFFGYFLLDKQKKSNRRAGMPDERHTDVSRFSRQRGKAKTKINVVRFPLPRE